jgi:hypothetical protein
MKIIELKINDSDLAGFETTALVESPAIQLDFVAFNKIKMADMTYNDYPESVVEAAKRGIEINKEMDNKCATQVGKVRAQQLANREPLSIETIQRMRSFLIRQKGNYELALRRKDYSACGYVSYLLWGGESALPWAERKLKQAGNEFSKQYFERHKSWNEFSEEQITEIIVDYLICDMMGLDPKEYFNIDVSSFPNYINEIGKKPIKDAFSELREKKMLVGPLMTPLKLIPRKDEKTGEMYNVFFTEETIEKIAHKMMQDKLIDSVNLEHNDDQRVNDVYLVETWIVKDPEKDKSLSYGFNPVKGQWYGIYKINNDKLWNDYVKTGKIKGFSIEGLFLPEILKDK